MILVSLPGSRVHASHVIINIENVFDSWDSSVPHLFNSVFEVLLNFLAFLSQNVFLIFNTVKNEIFDFVLKFEVERSIQRVEFVDHI
jgi:hypothetical protein